jgi:hypothetical protein
MPVFIHANGTDAQGIRRAVRSAHESRSDVGLRPTEIEPILGPRASLKIASGPGGGLVKLRRRLAIEL